MILFKLFASCNEIPTLNSGIMKLAHQIERDGFDTLKQDDVEELLI